MGKSKRAGLILGIVFLIGLLMFSSLSVALATEETSMENEQFSKKLYDIIKEKGISKEKAAEKKPQQGDKKPKRELPKLKNNFKQSYSEIYEEEPNDYPNEAQSVPLNSWVIGNLGYAYDIDAYRINVTQNGTLGLYAVAEGWEDLVILVVDENFNVVTTLDESFGEEFGEVYLNRGSYYVVVIEYEGTYYEGDPYYLALDFVPEVSGMFYDVPSDYWAYEEINYLAGRGIINGYEDGTFKPNNYVTRAQAVVMVVKALGLPLTYQSSVFSDVASDYWAKDYINTAIRNGIISGYSNGTFKPNNYVTRAQMASILAKAFRLTATSSVRFSDVRNDYWARIEINKVVTAGIANGYSDGTYRPGNSTTRAQMAVFLSRALQRF